MVVVGGGGGQLINQAPHNNNNNSCIGHIYHNRHKHFFRSVYICIIRLFRGYSSAPCSPSSKTGCLCKHACFFYENGN